MDQLIRVTKTLAACQHCCAKFFDSLVNFAEMLTKNYAVLSHNPLQVLCYFVEEISTKLTLFCCKGSKQIDSTSLEYFHKHLLSLKISTKTCFVEKFQKPNYFLRKFPQPICFFRRISRKICFF